MVSNLFENFLDDPREYELSEKFWMNIWQDVLDSVSQHNDWKTPWLGTGSPSIKDGNPIFSAISPTMRQGIRIIQQEPIESGLDFQVWLDTFGGPPTDPESINELVIACVLSDVAAYHAQLAMISWIEGGSLSFGRDDGGRLVLSPSRRKRIDYHWEIGYAA